jgi:hypothetical protein
MQSPRRDQRSYAVFVDEDLKQELAFEAWEEGLSLSAYVRKLLANRGKLARGGYALLKPK